MCFALQNRPEHPQPRTSVVFLCRLKEGFWAATCNIPELAESDGCALRMTSMLQKCANSTCSNSFRRLSEGKLFQVETEYFSSPELPSGRAARGGRRMNRIEHYWLCAECSSFLTLAFEKGCGMITVPLPGAVGRKTVRTLSFEDADRTLNLVEAVNP